MLGPRTRGADAAAQSVSSMRLSGAPVPRNSRRLKASSEERDLDICAQRIARVMPRVAGLASLGASPTGAIALIGRLRFDEPFEGRRSVPVTKLCDASERFLLFASFTCLFGCPEDEWHRRPHVDGGRLARRISLSPSSFGVGRSRPRPEARWALRFQDLAEGARRPMRAPDPSVAAEDPSMKWREDYCFLCFGSVTPVCVGAWVLFMLVPILFFILVRAISASAVAPRPAAHFLRVRCRSGRGSPSSSGRRQ